MVRDLQLIKKFELYNKKCLIWGAGKNGKILYNNLLKLGLQEKNLLFCDSNADKLNNTEFTILSIEQMSDLIAADRKDYIIIISVESIRIQDEIIDKIKELGFFDLNIYTLYGVVWGILFEKRKKGIAISESDLGIKNSDRELRVQNAVLRKVQYFLAAPYLEQMVLVYQPGKVGSTTVSSSLESQGVHNFQVHTLRDMQYIREIAKKRNAKIISMIRNPLEWRLSTFWHMIEHIYFDHLDADFYELQRISWNNFEEEEFLWFNNEMRNVMGINIFDYPFDRESGFTIIKSNNIELLLLTSEKMNQLENVIGEFVGINGFKLEDSNVGKKKHYRFAYEEYKKEFMITKSFFEDIYEREERWKHFYTDADLKRFREKWSSNIMDDKKKNELQLKIGVQ